MNRLSSTVLTAMQRFGLAALAIGCVTAQAAGDAPFTDFEGQPRTIESFAGDDSRTDVSATFLQPFVSYITQTKTTIALNTESTYDWEGKQWSLPINFTVNQLFHSGKQIYQIGGGVRYWADSPSNGPDGWGVRLQLTLLFPK